MSEQLFRAVEIPSDEPVQYVGCYVLKWGRVDQPSVGFIPVDDEPDRCGKLHAQRDELLAACEAAADYLVGFTAWEPFIVPESRLATWNMLQAAIAKARGEQP